MNLTDSLKWFSHEEDGEKEKPGAAERYAQVQSQLLKGELAQSQPVVVVMTLSHEIRAYLTERLHPMVYKLGYGYNVQPTVGEAADARVVIMDVTPKTDARLHVQYDKILRMKKSLGKKDDIACAFGPRERYRSYRRGTYPNLLYFCLEETDLNYPQPDLPPEGLVTMEGPRLFSFVDLPRVVIGKLKPQGA